MPAMGKLATWAANVSTTWGTAGTIAAATNGFYPKTIDPVVLKGEPNIDDASGMLGRTNYQRTQDIADPSITLAMRWNGHLEFLIMARWMGDDTVTGPSSNLYTHTMNYNEVNILTGGIGIVGRLDSSSANSIMEIPTMKVPSFVMQPADGFWDLSTNQTIGNSVYVAGDGKITADNTAVGNVTYRTSGQRMKFKANPWRMNAQSGDALDADDAVLDVANMSISFEDSYHDMRDVLLDSTTPNENAEPIPTGEGKRIMVSYEQKIYDYATHRNVLNAGTEWKADLVQTETIGGDAYSFTMQFGRLISIDPQVVSERGLMMPMTHNYEAIDPASAPTGMAAATPVHIILANLLSRTYETNAAP